MSMHQSDYTGLFATAFSWFSDATAKGASSQTSLEQALLAVVGAIVSANIPVAAPLVTAAETIVSGLIAPPAATPAAVATVAPGAVTVSATQVTATA